MPLLKRLPYRTRHSRKRQAIGFVCLLVYLMVWAANAQAVPLWFMLSGHPHRLFFTQEAHAVRIALHHPGHHDEHEPLPLASGANGRMASAHDSAALTAPKTESDHVIQLPAQQEQAASATPGPKTVKAFPVPATVLAPAVLTGGFPDPPRARPPPRVNAILLYLCTVVLLN